jgi:hypothetical protein
LRCTRCRKSFTQYEAGAYPRRQFQPDVVAQAVAMHTGAAMPARHVAQAVGASVTSVRRWTCWTAALVDPAEALAVAARTDPEVPHGLGAATRAVLDGVRRLAAQVLDALESLGAALLRAGLTLAPRTGLGRFLAWQYATHGVSVALTNGGRTASPRMVLEETAATSARSTAHELPRRPGRPAPAPGAPALPADRRGSGGPEG